MTRYPELSKDESIPSPNAQIILYLPHESNNFFTKLLWLREIIFVHKNQTCLKPVPPVKRYKYKQCKYSTGPKAFAKGFLSASGILPIRSLNDFLHQ